MSAMQPMQSEEVAKLFKNVLQEITQNLQELMEELWLNWSHMGIDDKAKTTHMMTLIHIEKNLHQEMVSEVRHKINLLQAEVDKLKEEAQELGKYLGTEITICEFEEDMMLIDYKHELERQIKGYREKVHEKRIVIERLLEWQRDLAEKLGVTIQELSEVPLPTEEELEKFKAHLNVLQAERDKRAEMFLNTQVEIKDIMEKLQIKPVNKFEHMVVTSLSVDFKVTDLNMDRLNKLWQELQEKYEQTNNRVLELRERLMKLWECLEEDLVYRENFLQAHQGCNPQTEAAIKEEIKRCEQIKKQKIQVFVANMRTKIKLMWDELMYSQQEREEFIHYYQDIFTEDTLTLHELYLEKITNFYQEHKHIFELVQTRKSLWAKMTELESRASEPGRYQNRGGQLLREEKERKAIANKLPKIEEQLKALVSEYEQKTGNTFTIDGKPLRQLIDDAWEARKAERHNKLSARKQGLTPSSQNLRALATSPLGKRNRTAAGLLAPNTAEKNRPPAKRALITGSATKAAPNQTSNLSALKRCASTTVKRRISGRLAARAVAEGKGENAKRKLDYAALTPHKVNGCILKHKRRVSGRKSSSRQSTSAAASETDRTDRTEPTEPTEPRDPLIETMLVNSYSDFKHDIHEKQVSRSSVANSKDIIPEINIFPVLQEICNESPNRAPKKTPRKFVTPKAKVAKENIPSLNVETTPRNMLVTPTRVTRSAVKVPVDKFLTPRAPLSAQKPLSRYNTASTFQVSSPSPATVSRSRSHAQLFRSRNLAVFI